MTTELLFHKKNSTLPSRRSEQWLIAGHYDPDFVPSVQGDIEDLNRLEPNWDGYGTPRIDPAVTLAAKSFVASLPENLAYRPRVVPMSNGTLQLEWHHADKSLELEFETPTTIHYLQWHPSAQIEEEGIIQASDTDTAIELIQWFMLGTCV